MPYDAAKDASPLTPALTVALFSSVWRTLSWSMNLTAGQIDRWRSLAASIPDRDLRADALSSLAEKRGYADGAALFTIIPGRRNHALLEVLVAYETIVD